MIIGKKKSFQTDSDLRIVRAARIVDDWGRKIFQ
jgi:hypothetical protein